jgi:hypothetical protein
MDADCASGINSFVHNGHTESWTDPPGFSLLYPKLSLSGVFLILDAEAHLSLLPIVSLFNHDFILH